jgi:hypothetical protein
MKRHEKILGDGRRRIAGVVDADRAAAASAERITATGDGAQESVKKFAKKKIASAAAAALSSTPTRIGGRGGAGE